jgi:ABC-type transporter Mla subunit MlaD
MKNWLRLHYSPRVVLIIPWFVLGVLLCWPAFELGLLLHGTRPGLTSTACALDWLTDCHKNSACLPSQTLATVGSIRAASAQSYQASKQMQLTAVEGLAFLKDVRRDTHSVLSELQTSIHETGLLVSDTRQRLNTALEDADLAAKSGNQLLLTANSTLLPLKNSLDNIDRLTKLAADQLAAGSPKVQQTMTDLDRAVDDFAKLLEDKNIQATIANIAGTSGHLDGAAESIDDALRPWRKRAGLLKTIVSKAFNMLKLTFPVR